MRCLPLFCLLLLACGGGEDGADKGKGKHQGKPTPVTVVEVAPVGRGTVADVLVSSAVVESEAAADIIPSAAGVVRSIARDEGDVVHKGDLLAVLDNVSLDAGAQRTRAEVTRLSQQVAQLEQLRSQGAVSERELDDLRYQLQVARTSAREARRSFGHTRLTAPFDGVVARRDVRVGELASSARAAFRVVDLDRLRVVASLPERDVRRVSLGQHARLISAYDEDVWATGVVARLAPIIDASSGTFRVTLVLDPAEHTLRPGQFVSVALTVDQHQDVIVIPKPALLWEDGQPVAYLMVPAPPDDAKPAADDLPGGGWWPEALARAVGSTPDPKPTPEDDSAFVAQRVLLEIGLTDAVSVEVISGLSEQDQLIVVGQSNLRDGAKVRTPKQAPAAEGAATEGPG